MTSVLKQIGDQLYDGFSDKDIAKKFDSSNIDQGRVVVITQHNSKSYQVDSLTYDLAPDTYFFELKDGSKVSMTQYFYERYKIKLNPK